MNMKHMNMKHMEAAIGYLHFRLTLFTLELQTKVRKIVDTTQYHLYIP